jgi:hypothetical protein
MAHRILLIIVVIGIRVEGPLVDNWERYLRKFICSLIFNFNLRIISTPSTLFGGAGMLMLEFWVHPTCRTILGIVKRLLAWRVDWRCLAQTTMVTRSSIFRLRVYPWTYS